LALGAAIACPDRKVVHLQADGSGMYTVQALWSMAREKTDVVIVVLKSQNIDDAGEEAGLQYQLSESECAKRRLFGRLQHDRAAHRQAGASFHAAMSSGKFQGMI
jgi:thiamine pyrophosphate-dependent acetolactate synthase large subunit-like protein